MSLDENQSSIYQNYIGIQRGDWDIRENDLRSYWSITETNPQGYEYETHTFYIKEEWRKDSNAGWVNENGNFYVGAYEPYDINGDENEPFGHFYRHIINQQTFYNGGITTKIISEQEYNDGINGQNARLYHTYTGLYSSSDLSFLSNDDPNIRRIKFLVPVQIGNGIQYEDKEAIITQTNNKISLSIDNVLCSFGNSVYKDATSGELDRINVFYLKSVGIVIMTYASVNSQASNRQGFNLWKYEDSSYSAKLPEVKVNAWGCKVYGFMKIK